jgi:hypothetical protein
MYFLRTFFLTTFLLLTLLLGFIYSVDPYDKYGLNVFGFETKAVAMARENKFNMVEHSRKKYEAFVIGSSSAHRLHTDDVTELTGLLAFNYAVQHTTPEDYLAITRHILSKTSPKMILFQMDLYGLNKNFKTDTRFYTSPLLPYLKGDNKETTPSHPLFDSDYFTIGAISDSFKVVWVNMTGRIKHLYLENGNYQKEVAYKGAVIVTQFSYENYEIDPKRVELLKEMKRLCDEKGTKLIVWTAPYSLEHINMLESDAKLKADLSMFKLTLRQIFGEVYDFTNTAVERYNSSTYFRDSSHPTRDLFKLMLTNIFKNSPQGEFGKKITPKN